MLFIIFPNLCKVELGERNTVHLCFTKNFSEEKSKCFIAIQNKSDKYGLLCSVVSSSIVCLKDDVELNGVAGCGYMNQQEYETSWNSIYPENLMDSNPVVQKIVFSCLNQMVKVERELSLFEMVALKAKEDLQFMEDKLFAERIYGK